MLKRRAARVASRRVAWSLVGESRATTRLVADACDCVPRPLRVRVVKIPAARCTPLPLSVARAVPPAWIRVATSLRGKRPARTTRWRAAHWSHISLARSSGVPKPYKSISAAIWVQIVPSLVIRGRPRWDDRFSQYGIKLSFWGSGTLKIVIYVENTTPRNRTLSVGLLSPLCGGGC